SVLRLPAGPMGLGGRKPATEIPGLNITRTNNSVPGLMSWVVLARRRRSWGYSNSEWRRGSTRRRCRRRSWITTMSTSAANANSPYDHGWHRVPHPEQQAGEHGTAHQPEAGERQSQVQRAVRVPDRAPGSLRLRTDRHGRWLPAQTPGQPNSITRFDRL